MNDIEFFSFSFDLDIYFILFCMFFNLCFMKFDKFFIDFFYLIKIVF